MGSWRIYNFHLAHHSQIKVHHFPFCQDMPAFTYRYFFIYFFLVEKRDHVYDNEQTSEANWAPALGASGYVQTVTIEKEIYQTIEIERKEIKRKESI